MKVSELFESSLVEGYAIKLKSGSWYSEERPSLGPLKGGNAQVRVFKSMGAADDFMIMQQNSKFGGKKFEDAEIKRYSPKKLKEGFEAELTDAIKLNWLSWSVSKIVDHLKLQMKSGKWPELKGKSDDELHDYVDNAKDNARNQVDESLNEGMYVIKNKDGKEKRFKNHESPEAQAWKASSSPKKTTVKLAVYSDAYWAKKEDDAHDKDDYDYVTPWKPIKNDYAATDKINAVVEDQFNTEKIDWTLGKGGEMKREGTTCATIVVRVMYEYGPEDDMGVDEPVQDAQNILVARNPKKPTQLDFVQFV